MDHQVYREVVIRSISALSKFNRTIVMNANTANMVRKVNLRMVIDEENPEDIAHIYTLLYNLPKLQHFISTWPPCLTAIMDALLDSKLNDLITLGDFVENDFSNDYVTCTLLLRDRLQNLLLADVGVLYNRLYNRLDQFKKLEEITIVAASANPIKQIDSVVEKCRDLQRVTIWFDGECDEEITATVDENDIPLLYTPRPAVNTLKIKREVEDLHQNLLVYIMHKYPKLKRFEFDAGCVEVTDASTFKRLLSYLTTIEDMTIGEIGIDPKWICDGVGSYWEATRLHKPHTYVHLKIEPTLIGSDIAFFTIYSRQNITAIQFPLSNYDFQNMDLLAKYGEHIGYLLISGFDKRTLRRGNREVGIKSIENLIASSIMFCRQLRILVFYESRIRSTEKSIIWKTAYLQKLMFKVCNIGDRVFPTIFSGISRVDTMVFEQCKFRDENRKVTSFISIDMPNTVLGSVSLKYLGDLFFAPTSIYFLISKIDDSSERVNEYYMYDFLKHDDVYLKASSESEYYDVNFSQYTHLKISCRSITSLKVEDSYLEHKIDHIFSICSLN